MERKEINHLAIELIENALGEPNKTLILEEIVKKPKGVEISDEQLEDIRDYLMKFIKVLSNSEVYNFYCSDLDFGNNAVKYNNGSMIKRYNMEVQ